MKIKLSNIMWQTKWGLQSSISHLPEELVLDLDDFEMTFDADDAFMAAYFSAKEHLEKKHDFEIITAGVSFVK